MFKLGKTLSEELKTLFEEARKVEVEKLSIRYLSGKIYKIMNPFDFDNIKIPTYVVPTYVDRRGKTEYTDVIRRYIIVHKVTGKKGTLYVDNETTSSRLTNASLSKLNLHPEDYKKILSRTFKLYTSNTKHGHSETPEELNKTYFLLERIFNRENYDDILNIQQNFMLDKIEPDSVFSLKEYESIINKLEKGELIKGGKNSTKNKKRQNKNSTKRNFTKRQKKNPS